MFHAGVIGRAQKDVIGGPLTIGECGVASRKRRPAHQAARYRRNVSDPATSILFPTTAGSWTGVSSGPLSCGPSPANPCRFLRRESSSKNAGPPELLAI